MTTQGTQICLILSFILRGGQVAFINPNTRQGMVPWSIRRVTDLPPNAKLCENTHGLVQLIIATTPDVPNQPQHHNCPNKCSMRALYHPHASLYRAMQKSWFRAPYQKWPKKMPGTRLTR